MSMLTVEECELLSDSKYRSYISQVEKALKSFEYTSEWADLISALGKLNKVLLNHLKYPVIPKKVTIGKRLAQCLHPALPSGVHLKALEAYDIIFKCIGPHRLAQDLFVYSAGLFPVIAHAAMSVKPVLLTVYENHFVPLGRQIRPGLNGLLLGLLPGLEEGAEYFDRTNTLLEEFCEAADPPFFYTGLWECVLNCPSVRLPAVTFLLNHFNKRRTMEDQLHMMGLDIDLMVQALCNALLDNSVLVQRSTLDFLLSAFPMHNGQLTRTDLASVVEAAINVVLRRDMSLNRRLYLWLLGTPAHQSQANTLATANLAACSPVETTLLRRPRADSSSTTSEFDLAYFNTYSRELLVQALKHKMSTTGRDVRLGEDGHLIVLRPFRILISLLDKPEIGPVIIEDVLLSVFRSLYEEGTKRDDEIGPPPASSSSAATVPVSGAMAAKTLARDSKHVDELIKTANLLFGSFEAYFIWDFIGRLFSSACECTRTGMQRKGNLPSDSGIATCDAISIKELCHIVEFLLDIISLDVYPESTTEHLPDLLHQVITAATGCVEAASDVELTAILNICSKLLSRVQPSMATPSEDDPFDSDSPCRVPDAVANFRTNEVIANRVDDVSSYDKADDKKGDSIEDENANKMRVAGDEISNVTDCINREESTVEEISRHEDSKNQTDQSGIDVTAPDSKREEIGSIKTDVSESDSDIVVADELLNERDAEKGQLNGDDISETMSSLASEATLESFEKTSAGVEEEVASRKEDVSCGSKEVTTDPQKGPAYPMTDTSVKVSPQEKLTREMSLRSSSRDILRCAARQKSRDDKPREHLGLMQQCLGSFQEFFHCIIIHRFLESETVCEKCIDLLTLPVSECRTSDQDSLFDESSQCSADNDLLRTRLLESVSHPKVKPRLCTDEGHETFSRACRLLVDFASFPLYCADYQTVIDQMYSMEEVGSLPPWLQDLLTCSCYVSSFPLQASAIATMLDLITLTKSVHSETQNKTRDTGRMSVSEGRVSVVILPALLPRHLQHINDCTIFYQVTAQELWHHLSCENSEQHYRTAELFYTLHQVTPRAWICEDIMGNDLISEDETRRLNAFKKFSILWHLTRNMKADSTLGHEVRTFDRSMFVVLDSLKEESSPAKSLAVNWLTHVVQRGDISRVLRPVLLMLLHPDTARISVQHVNVHEPKRVSLAVESEDYDHNPEANIYAISSEGGNLIFHVNHNKPRMNLSRKSTEDLQSIALTVLSDKGRQTTAPVRAHSEAELTYERVNPKDLQLRFNPFGSVSSLDKLIFDGYEFPPSSGSMSQRQTKIPTSAKRLDKETCQREGIFFDGKEELEPAPEIPLEVFTEKEPTSEEVVAEILTEVLNRVMVKVVENQLEGQRKGSVTSSQMCDHDLLNAIEAASLEMDSTSSSENDLCEASAQQNRKGATGLKVGVNGAEGELEEAVPEGIHQLHMHLLLYTQAYDYRRTIYALSTVRSMLVQCPRLVVTAMATTTISSVRVPHMVQVQTLLARHRKSVFGKNFFGELPAEVLSGYRSNMFLEVVISLCLYCMRGYFPNLMMSRLTDDELLGNNLVHIQAAEVLTLLLSELLSIMRDSGRSFVSYISDLLGRCKLQKALLHTLLASVYDTRSKTHRGTKNAGSLSEAIIQFNDSGIDVSVKEAFQLGLLRLVLVTIMLEDQITLSVGNIGPDVPASTTSEWDRMRNSVQYSLTKVRFRPTETITQQTMFLSGVLSALKQRHMAHLHRHWIGLVTSALPFMGRSLTQVVLCVVSQLCRNLEGLAAECSSTDSKLVSVPPDHTVTMLEGLTTLCHYCLLDSNTNVSIGQPAPAPTSTVTTETASSGHILTNLIHVFNPIGSSRETSPQRDLSPMSPVLEARNNLLSILPRIMACMATLWKAVNKDCISNAKRPSDGMKKLIMGDPKVMDDAVRQHILELLSPLSLLHGNHLLGAFAVAWNDRRQNPNGPIKKAGVLMTPCEDQQLLVELVVAIKVLPMDSLIQTVKSVLKQPPHTELSKNKKSVPLEINLLQLFFAYVQRQSSTQLLDSWPALLLLIKDVMAMGLQPPSTFILLHILNDFVQKAPAMEEKKAQKELQDITQKLLDSVALIAGTSLEQTTWLRRNYAVKPGRQLEAAGEGDDADSDDILPLPQPKVKEVSPGTVDLKFSVQALMLLADLTASMLDVVYSSEEKEKVVPFLTILLQNVFPYLRHHSTDNMPSYRACSQLLSSVSGYQYSRKAWRKECLELLLDVSFFQMDGRSLSSWKTVVDNLLTHDRTTFKDLMNRVSMTQSGSLNLFSSKEQEFELRAQMLKRLSFAIFCSPLDQYQRNMPEIQERLSESLRLNHVPYVMAQVFLCFRVLILRMSPQHLTSLWPTMITEMVQVFLQIEQELSTDTDEFKTQLQRIAALDSSWAHLGNGLNAHNNPSWLGLYLSVCRLLDLCLVMPADSVPQFQLYRWAFIGTAGEENKGQGDDTPKQKDQPRFTPHIVRLARLLNSRLNRQAPVLRTFPGRPLLTMGHLRSVAELQPFFNTLCLQQSEKAFTTTSGKKAAAASGKAAKSAGGGSSGQSLLGMTKSISAPEKVDSKQTPEMHLKTSRQYVEELLERDFLETVF